jgi:DNA topoisomerase III
MKKLLVLAEKKSLAEKIAKGIGKYTFQKDHYHAEGNGVSADIYYLFGHLLQVDLQKSFPDGYGHFPEKLKHGIQKGRSSLFKAVKDALERAKKGEYDYVVSAGDPDREGELLVREVLEACRVPKEKCLRAWWNSETSKATAEGVLNAKPLKNYDSLYYAGRARKFGDLWLGINLSRVLHDKTGNRNLSLGRVQTPVLYLIVKRQEEIENFKPTPFWVVSALLEKDGQKFTAKTQQIKEEEKAKSLYEILKKLPYLTVKSVEKKKKKQAPPKLPRLSDIQSEVGSKLKMTSSQVLSVVQKLYEAGILSYPRTEANYLSEGDLETAKAFLLETGRKEMAERLYFPEVKKRIVNNKAVEKAGHHALIPLKTLPENATPQEKAVYKAVERRLLANLMPDFEYEETTAVFEVNGEKLTAKGRVVLRAGWKELYGLKDEEGKEEENQSLPELKEGEKVKKVKEFIKKDFTKPPSPYTSATLTTTMRKLGLGTEATRHTFEEVLIKRGYVKREKGKLYPTEAGRKLIKTVEHLSFAKPEETAKWEKLLEKIAFKEKNPLEGEREFLEGVKKLTLLGIKELEKSDVSFLVKKPSEKMVKMALYLAQKAGIEVDESRLKEDFSYCRKLIDELIDKVPKDKPSEKQIELAKKIAEEKGIEIPEECLEDKYAMSKWLDKQMKGNKKRGKPSYKGKNKGKSRKKSYSKRNRR